MIIVVNEHTREIFPASIRRRAGITVGTKLEVTLSGGVITMLPVPPTDDEYTPEQRRVIDAHIADGLDDLEHGRTQGPFDS